MIHFFVGTRAQLLKMAPVMRECRSRGLKWRWIYAAQHRDKMDDTLDFFDLPQPDYELLPDGTEVNSVLKMSKWILSMTRRLGSAQRALDGYTGPEHIVLTHGDTTTTVFGAITGRITRTKVMHVESGLRSHNILSPFPEELNRLLTFRMTDYFACPNAWAMSNVEKHSGIRFNTHGNTQVDVLAYGLANLEKATIELPPDPFAVLSFHRFENLARAGRLRSILEIAQAASRRMQVIMPLHPATLVQLEKSGALKHLTVNENLHVLPRLRYEDFLSAILHSEFVMTDGGGNQEELALLGIPTLLLRTESERTEGLGENAVLSNLKIDASVQFISHYGDYRRQPASLAPSPSSIIVDRLVEYGEIRPN